MSAFGPATRANALERMEEFAPRMGEQYARDRNTDPGPDRRTNVSNLSPFLKRRLVLEQEAVDLAIRTHGPDDAEKYVQEVVWRTYFKGWLEQRPSVWTDYLEGRKAAFDRIGATPVLRKNYERAIEGGTGIEPFDAWAQELVEQGYLHNHARMWFASIWIFTLKLPWELGADFFMRHLLDGDAASNTCSWRWVGGRHTLGKTYQASASNIARFTNGRFDVGPNELAHDAEAPAELTLPDTQGIPRLPTPRTGLKTGLLVHVEDCMPESLDIAHDLIATVDVTDTHRDTRVQAYDKEALADVRDRNEGCENLASPDAIAGWVSRNELQQIVMPYCPIGPVRDALMPALDAQDIDVVEVRREWDSAFWPAATAGFFKVKKRIPKVLDSLDIG